MKSLFGACLWGKRTISYEVKEEEACSVFPAVGDEPVNPQLIYDWYLFDQACSDSQDFMQSQMFWVVTIFGIFAFLCFACLLFLVCRKYRAVKHRYNRLLENPGRSSDVNVPHSEADPGHIELSNL